MHTALRRMVVRLALLAIALTASMPAPAQEDGIREVTVALAAGQHAATLSDKLRGRGIIDYHLRATAGQPMAVTLDASNRFTFFNIMAPDANEALFIGSIHGGHYQGIAESTGTYTVRVYLMPNAARRDERTAFDITFRLDESTPPAPNLGFPSRPGAAATPFDTTLALAGISFHVRCANAGSLNTLRITPTGLGNDNTEIVREVDGGVAGAEVADLDADGSPELYVYITSAGSGSYGSLVAYAANRRRSLSEIYLPPVTDNAGAARGYMGHDESAVVEDRLVQRFPIYREGDTNASPSGRTRQLQYKLVPGEAGWQLRLDRVVEY